MEHEVDLGMTLYDMNKNIMEHENPMSPTALRKALEQVAVYFDTQNTYFMLLCRELHDYTIFCREKNDFGKFAASELKECLINRGLILSIEKNQDNVYEIWIRNEAGIFVYYLFPYDEAVIEC